MTEICQGSQSSQSSQSRQSSRSSQTSFIGAEDIIADIDVIAGEGVHVDYFTYKGRPINVHFEYLIRGAYGDVYRATFVLDGQTYYFAVKRGIDGDLFKLNEARVIERHTASVSCPGVISMKVREYAPYNTIAIMPLADSDLATHAGKFTHKQATQVVDVVRQALVCFHANGDYYYDLKPNNILVNCHGGVSTFYLGDMGSIIPDAYGYVTTYPPPEFPNCYISDTTHALKHYTYILACLYCSLISGLEPPGCNDTSAEFGPILKRLVNETMRKLGISITDDVPDHVSVLYMVSDILQTGRPLETYLDYIMPIDQYTAMDVDEEDA